MQTYWEPLTPDERKQPGAPLRLPELEQVADALARQATRD